MRLKSNLTKSVTVVKVFSRGDPVKIIAGPYKGKNGLIQTVDMKKREATITLTETSETIVTPTVNIARPSGTKSLKGGTLIDVAPQYANQTLTNRLRDQQEEK